jgi:release factor glutamine methyltransferase
VSSGPSDQSTPVVTMRQLVARVAGRLESESEAKWIVADAAGIAPGEILTFLDRAVSAGTVDVVEAMADRRAAGEPLQYILGSWSFRRLEVRVDDRVLVPRPETEQVVEMALEELRSPVRSGRDRRRPGPPVVVDLGTGSGVIALSIALEEEGLEVWATDASARALELAAENLADFSLAHPVAGSRVHLVEGSWFEALPPDLAGRVDLVVSNPPYVSAAEWSAIDPEISEHEPVSAFVPGPTGLESLEKLVDQSCRWLAPGGSLVLELAPHQAETVTTMAKKSGYVDVRIRPDLAGRARALVARWPDGEGAG